jgi:hypothetical protein
MVIGPFPAAQFSSPGTKYGVQAGANYLNSHGGLGTNHSKINVIACNGQAEAAPEATCMSQAVSDHVAAMVGGFLFYPSNGFGALASANIPVLAAVPATPDTYASKVSFPLFFNQSLFIAIAEAAVKNGCKKVDYVTVDVAVGAALKAPIEAGIKVAGGVPGDTITVPVTATDFAPVVAQVEAGNSDCILADVLPSGMPGLLGAISSSGKQIAVYSSVGVLTPQATAASPKTYEGTYMSSAFPALDSSIPGFNNYVSSLEAIGQTSTEAQDANAFDGWLGMMMLQQATAGQSTISGTEILNYMRNASSMSLGYGMPTINFTQPVNQTTYSGIYQTNIFIQRASNGAYGVVSSVDTRSALESLSP